MDYDLEKLLDFDTTLLAGYEPATTERALREHREMFANHLAIARWVQDWADRLEPETDIEGNEHFIRALREIAAHLRQADFLPGGPLLR